MTAARERSAALWTTEITAADRLFVGLDHCPIHGARGGPPLEVLGVHLTPDRDAWVQLAVEGDPRQAVVLHLLQTTTIDETIAALAEWAETPLDDRPRSIDLTPRV